MKEYINKAIIDDLQIKFNEILQYDVANNKQLTNVLRLKVRALESLLIPVMLESEIKEIKDFSARINKITVSQDQYEYNTCLFGMYDLLNKVKYRVCQQELNKGGVL